MKLFLVQLVGELKKLFTRRRTYIGYVVFVVFEVILLTVWNLEGTRKWMKSLMEDNALSVEEYFSSLTLTFQVLRVCMYMMGAIYFALIAGDIVAKESEDGNLRMVLSRPVSRFRVLLLKYVATMIYTVSFVTFVAVTGYLMAVLAMGADGGLFIWNYGLKVFAVYPDWGEAVGRLLLGTFFIGLSMCTLSSIGFFFSCLKVKPAAATILALSVLSVDMALWQFPFFKPYQEYFITYLMANWLYVFEPYLSWPKLAESYAMLVGINLTLFVVGWVVFQLRDFKT